MRLGNQVKERWDLFAALLLAFSTALFLAPALFGGRVFFLKDAQLWFYPSRLLWRARVLAGDLPLWMPELDLGMPFLADSGHGVLYPLNVLLLLTPPACVGQFLAVHIVLAALGTYALLRLLGVQRSSAFTGALGYALGGFLLSMTWSGVYLLSVAWIPLVAATALRLARRGRPLDIACTALTLGCQILTGEVQGAALGGLVVLGLVLAERAPWRQRLVALARLAVSALLALALALPQLLPSLGLLSEITRGKGIPLEEASHWSFHPLRLVELIAAGFFGDPTAKASYLGFFLNDEGGTVHRAPWMLTPYLGSICLALATVGLIRPLRQHRRWTIAVALIGGFALLLALGRHTPVFAAFYRMVPGADLFRYPAKYFAVTALMLPILAAAGLDSCLSADRDGCRRPIVTAVASTLCLLVALGAALALASTAGRALQTLRPSVSPEDATATVRWALLREGALLLLLGCGLWLAWRRRQAWIGHFTAAAVGIQLVAANISVPRTTDGQIYDRPPLLARKIRDAVAPGQLPRLYHPPLAVGPAYDFARSPDERAALLTESLALNVGAVFGIGYPSAYTAAVRTVRDEFWAATERFQKQTLDLYGITHVLVPAGIEVPPGIGLEQVFSSAALDLRQFRNTRALPLAYPVRQVVRATSSSAALAALRLPQIQRGWSAVIEGLDPPQASQSGSTAGRCSATRPSGDEIRVSCDLPQAAWVVVNESHNHNWNGALDGRSTRLYRANAIVIASRMPAGRHVLHLTYREPSLVPGLVGVGAGLLVCCALLWVDLRGRRARRKDTA